MAQNVAVRTLPSCHFDVIFLSIAYTLPLSSTISTEFIEPTLPFENGNTPLTGVNPLTRSGLKRGICTI